MGTLPKARHDRGYRRLFSKPRLIQDLIRGFFGQKWVHRLDFRTMERVSSSFVARNLGARESDMVWTLRTRGDRPVSIYLLLEFQSTVDRHMAARMMAYVALLQLDLVAEGKLTPDGKFPLIIPIVLFNGDGRWSAAHNAAELVEVVDAEADEFRPGLKYRLIDEGSYDLRKLRRRKNLAAVLFWLERTPDPVDLRRGVRRLVQLLSGPDDGELRAAFASWLQLVRLPGQGLTEEDIPEVLGLEEFRDMLEKRVEEWNKTLLEKGRQSGLQEGERKGEQQGEAKFLLRLLERKFGRVASPVRKRVMAANPDRLLEWGERVLEAARLEEVFGES